MISSLAVILLCQLAGEIVARLTHLPVPGPVIGMALLFIGLVIRGGPPAALEKTTGGLLANLSLLFVPAGVGIMRHLDLILSQWLPILLGVLVSTALTIGVTALIMQRAAKPEAE